MGARCAPLLSLEAPARGAVRSRGDAGLARFVPAPARRADPAAAARRDRAPDDGPNTTPEVPPPAAGRALRPGRSVGMLTGVLSDGALPAPEPPPRVERLTVTPPVPAPTCSAVSPRPASTVAPSLPGVTPTVGEPGTSLMPGSAGASGTGPAGAAAAGNASESASAANAVAAERGKETIRIRYGPIRTSRNAVLLFL